MEQHSTHHGDNSQKGKGRVRSSSGWGGGWGGGWGDSINSVVITKDLYIRCGLEALAVEIKGGLSTKGVNESVTSGGCSKTKFMIGETGDNHP